MIARKVGAARFARLERESRLLAPISFPEAPSPMASVIGKVTDIEVRNDGRTHAIITIDGTLERAVTLYGDAEQISAPTPAAWEVVLALCNTGPYSIKHRVAVWAATSESLHGR
ncbi:MAG TPA: hypothetical protein VHW96_11695 [Solirubrobacteraceae bacterium]|nr:hypothetical protein [Solirubrobacteraceae bacterium]